MTPTRRPVISAGVLAYRRREGAVEFLLVHPGGPYWRSQDLAAWSFPKGLAEPGENLADAARREFTEELGFPVSTPLAPLAACPQPGGKVARAWMTEADFDLGRFHSNDFELEWPPRSGQRRRFPEVDRAAYIPEQEALRKIHRSLRPILLEAMMRLSAPPSASVGPGA